jgi:hypothetical protein
LTTLGDYYVEVRGSNTSVTGNYSFSIETPIDTTPDAFTFIAQTNASPNTVTTSNAINVSGITAAAPISITGGTFSINGGVYTNVAKTVSNGDTVTVRLTSSANYSTTTSATLTIGGVFGPFSVTTLAIPILTVTKSGSGNGSVTPDSGSLTWVGFTGSGVYSYNTQVKLMASPDSNSTFGAWSGDCVPTGSNCTASMTANRNVTATFTAAPKVMVGTKVFSSLQAAYKDTGTQNGSIIKMLGGSLTGCLTADREIIVTIEGGYDSDYIGNNDKTTIHGNILINAGCVSLESVIVGPQPQVHIPGDLNNDGIVNGADSSILSANYGQNNCGNVADINGDCKVDVNDLSILSGNYAKSVCDYLSEQNL